MIYYKKQKISVIDDIYKEFKKTEFNSPRRSTIPLMVLFKNNQIIDEELINKNFINEVDYIFEYETSVVKGKGSPSCTDLLINYSNGCIGIEAKRTEPPYKKVEKWLGTSVNKKLVIEGWLELINSYTGLKVTLREIKNLPYQLIHRVASACSLKKEHTKIVYIGFDLNQKMTNYYLNCLNVFSTILENKIDLYLYCYKIEKSRDFINLEKKWDLGERNLSIDVINGLKKNGLMTLSKEKKIKINKNS